MDGTAWKKLRPQELGVEICAPSGSIFELCLLPLCWSPVLSLHLWKLLNDPCYILSHQRTYPVFSSGLGQSSAYISSQNKSVLLSTTRYLGMGAQRCLWESRHLPSRFWPLSSAREGPMTGRSLLTQSWHSIGQSFNPRAYNLIAFS